MALAEIRRRRVIARVGRNDYYGVRSFCCFNGEAPAYVDALYKSGFPGATALRARKVEAEYDGENMVGVAVITAVYEKRRVPNVGRLIIRPSSVPWTPWQDRKKRWLQGEEMVECPDPAASID